MLHGTAFWPGLRTGVVSCSYTCGHGPTPGVASLVIPFQPVATLAQEGTLRIWDGVNRPLVLKGCRVVRADAVELGDGPGLALTIEDRRWRWRYGVLDGSYNQVDNNPDPARMPIGDFYTAGGPFIPGTERTPQQLLSLCLGSMGETYAFFGVPEAARPPVDWRATTPARAAADVAEAVGCRLVYQPFADRAIVAAPGGFVKLDARLPILQDHPGIKTPPGPTQIVVNGGASLIADYLKLEAVGYEADGRVRRIEDLSYAPRNGSWWNCPPEFPHMHVTVGDSGNIETSKALAKFVWRLFRVQAVPLNPRNGRKKGKPVVPTFPPIVDRRVIELADRVYTPNKDASGQFMTEPARVFANSYNRTGDRGGRGVNWNPVTVLDDSFSIDTANGFVTFDRPLYRIWEKSADASLEPYRPDIYGDTSFKLNQQQQRLADVYLYTSFRVRHPETFQHVPSRWHFRVAAPDAYGDRSQVVRDPNLVQVATVERFFQSDFRLKGRVKTNAAEVRAAAAVVADAEARKYQVSEATTRTYAGILTVDPDGGVQEVTWTIGGGPPTTTVSVNTEHANWLPSYAERRRNERQLGFLTEDWIRRTNDPRLA